MVAGGLLEGQTGRILCPGRDSACAFFPCRWDLSHVTGPQSPKPSPAHVLHQLCWDLTPPSLHFCTEASEESPEDQGNADPAGDQEHPRESPKSPKAILGWHSSIL